MTKIVRTLQHATWEYDTETKEVTLINYDINGKRNKSFTLNRLYTYSLGRFLIRSWQKMSQKQRKITNPLVKKDA
mgnify:CR=1 FL=1